MRSLPNIERSYFHRGEYVGYACGVWRIVKAHTGQWRATKRDGVGAMLIARTLTELSAKLAEYERN